MADQHTAPHATTRQAMQLARRLDAATLAGDWAAVAVLDRHVAALLRTTGSRPLSAQEDAALSRLQHAHRQARERCAFATERMAAQLNDMRSHKDGWLAYAVSSDEWSGSPP